MLYGKHTFNLAVANAVHLVMKLNGSVVIMNSNLDLVSDLR